LAETNDIFRTLEANHVSLIAAVSGPSITAITW